MKQFLLIAFSLFPTVAFAANNAVIPLNVGIGTSQTTTSAMTVMKGNVGIGTWAPGMSLDINGTMRATAFVGNGAALTNIIWTNNAGQLYPSAVTSNLGIGTSTPQAALAITNGGMGIGTWSIPSSEGLAVGGNMGIGVAAANNPLAIVANVNGNLLKVSSTYTPSGSYLFTNASATFATAATDVNSNTLLTLSTPNTLNQRSILYVKGNNGNTLTLWAGADGNVGIGTGVIGEGVHNSLSVVGSVGMAAGANSSFVTKSAPNGGMIVEGNVGMGTTNPQTTLAVSGGVGIGTWTLANGNALDVMNGNMGIGTYAVSNRLVMSTANNQGIELQGPSGETLSIEDINSGANHFFAFVPGTANTQGTMILNRSSRDWIGVWVRNAGGNYNTLYMDNVDNYMHFSTSITNPISLQPTSGGNVGVGTSVPNNKLTVVGNFGIGQVLASKYVSSSAPAGGLIAEGNVGIGSTTPQAWLVVNGGNVGIGTWSAAGGNLIVNGVGNVGIGSAWPGTTLDVNGAIRVLGFTMNGQSPANGKVLTTSDSTGDSYWGTSPASGGWAQALNNIYTSTGSNNVGIGTTTPQGGLIVANGNVGIGTWAPSSPLQVNGTLSIVDIASNGNLGIGTSGAPNQIYIYDSHGWGDPSLNINNPSGFAGINFTTFGFHFDDAGRSNVINYSTSALAGDTLALNVDPQINSGNQIQIESNIGIAFSTQGSQAMIVANSGNVGISSLAPNALLDVEGTQTPIALNAMSTAANNVGIGTFTPQGAFVVTNGNVGIGTWAAKGGALIVNGGISVGMNSAPYAFTLISQSSPQVLFESIGANNAVLTLNDNIGAWQDYLGFNNGGGQEYQFGKQGANTFFMWAQPYLRDYLREYYNVGSGILLLAPVGGNVGIGTTNPGQSLDVAGTVRVIGANGVYFGNDTRSDIQASASIAPDIQFLTNNTEQMRVTNGGNVGIATNTPNAMLDVRGSIDLGPTTNGSNAFQQRFTSDGSGSNARVLDACATFFQSGNAKSNLSCGGTESLSHFALNNNLLGIGTWVPTSTLSIGTTNAASGIGIGATYNSTYVTTASSPPGGIIAEGNVGIATTTPQAAMIINGNVGIGTWAAQGGSLIVNGGGDVGIGSIAPQAQLDLGTSSKPLVLPGLKAITGTRFLCISATGQLSSSPSPCSGT